MINTLDKLCLLINKILYLLVFDHLNKYELILNDITHLMIYKLIHLQYIYIYIKAVLYKIIIDLLNEYIMNDII